MSDTPTGYELSKQWFDFAFENPEKIRPVHTAIFFFAIEHYNRLGWKEKFGFPSQMVMEAIGVKNWRTYISAFNDLVEWGFFELIEKSKNQYSSNIIAIVKNTEAHTKALSKALQKHSQKQSNSTVSIDKQRTKNKEPKNGRFTPPTLEEVLPYMKERGGSHKEAEKFIDFYQSKDWYVGKNKMKDWKASVRNWTRSPKKDEQELPQYLKNYL